MGILPRIYKKRNTKYYFKMFLLLQSKKYTDKIVYYHFYISV